MAEKLSGLLDVNSLTHSSRVRDLADLYALSELKPVIVMTVAQAFKRAVDFQIQRGFGVVVPTKLASNTTWKNLYEDEFQAPDLNSLVLPSFEDALARAQTFSDPIFSNYHGAPLKSAQWIPEHGRWRFLPSSNTEVDEADSSLGISHPDLDM